MESIDYANSRNPVLYSVISSMLLPQKLSRTNGAYSLNRRRTFAVLPSPSSRSQSNDDRLRSSFLRRCPSSTLKNQRGHKAWNPDILKFPIHLVPFPNTSAQSAAPSHLTPHAASAILEFHGRGAAAMSSRVVFPIAFRTPGPKGPISVPPKSRGHRKPFRLGSQANTCSLSLVSPCGWSAIGIESVFSETADLPVLPPPVCI
jgi:hypothetical protein